MYWAVVKYFNYRKGTTQETLSIHPTHDKACKWAKRYCEWEYGKEECVDVSRSGEINACIRGTIYGKKDPWESWIFFVEEYSPPLLRTDSPVPYPPTSEDYYDDDEEEDDDNEHEAEEEDDDES